VLLVAVQIYYLRKPAVRGLIARRSKTAHVYVRDWDVMRSSCCAPFLLPIAYLALAPTELETPRRGAVQPDGNPLWCSRRLARHTAPVADRAEFPTCATRNTMVDRDSATGILCC